MAELSRRTLIKASGPVGAALLTGSLAPQEGAAQTMAAPARGSGSGAAINPAAAQPAPTTSYLFLNREEIAFVEAAVARRNDVYGTIQTISRVLSTGERSEIARYYGAQATRLAAGP